MPFFTKTLFMPLSFFCVVYLSGGTVLLDGDTLHQMSFDEMPSLDLADDLVMGDSRILSVIKNNIDGDAGAVSLRRNLLPGDFNEFNDIFRDAVIQLPPTTVSETVLFDLTINLKEMNCTNINVTDIVITYNKDESNQRLWFQVDVIDVAMNCFIEYDYEYGVLSGKGNAKAYSDDNNLTVLLAFDSTNFDEAPPTSSVVYNCTADISIKDLDFDGDWISTLMDVFERLIRGRIEDEVKAVACDKLSSLGNTFVNETLQLAADTLEPYLTELAATDPLASEKALQIPEDMVLLDFQDTDNVIGSWFDAALREADAFLGTVVDDDSAPSGTGRDLGVNVFLRDKILDADRSLVVNVASLPLENGGVLFQAQDKLMETTITLDSVKVFGLDTFTRFDSLIDIGQYTQQNEFSWSYIAMELDVTIDIKPSSGPDAIIQGSSDQNIVEKVKISFGVDELDAVVSVLLAIDQEALGSLKLGSMLDTSTMLPCLLSTVFAVEISELTVSIGNIREPTLDGFVSAGIDHIITRSVEAVFLMYEQVLLNATPTVFATSLRDLVNKQLIDKYISDRTNSECPLVDDVKDFIDFRDLLLKPDLAALIGGSGQEPYGNLASTLMTLVNDKFLATEDDGLPSINSILIGQITEAQSGVKGMLQFSSELFSLAEDNAMGLQLAVSNLRLRNLDTLTEPLSILQPSNDPHVLSNLINIGPVAGRSLNGTFRLLIGLDSLVPSLSTINEMDVSASVASSVLSTDILAKINATELMQFPLRDIVNMNCWLAKFPAPELDVNGVQVASSGNSSLALVQFFMSLTAFSLDVACIDCRSPGVAVLPDLLNMLEGFGSISLLKARLEYLAQDIIMSDWMQLYLDQHLSNAPKSCPHSAEYDENFAKNATSGPGFPSLSREGVETLVYAAAIAAETAMVAIAESYSSYNANETDSLSRQNNLQVPEGVRLLDLTALGTTVGSWVDSAIEEVDGFLTDMTDDVGGPDGDTDLRINVFIRDRFLDDCRAFSFTFDDLSIVGDEIEIALKEIRILGLDTFTTVGVLNLIAPQTIENEFALQNLSVELDVSIKTAPSSSSARLLQKAEILTVSFVVRDVNATLGLFLAFDQDLLGSLTLASMMNMDRIPPCLISSAYGVEMTKLSVTVGEMDGILFTGFVSEQIDDNIKNLTQSIDDEYGASMIAAVPGIFDVTVRGLINNWIKYYLDLDSSTSCPESELELSQSGFIQFPDMFLSREEAIALGGRGESQYGDLFRRLYNLVKEEILQIDETNGTSSINELLIAPLTHRVSGTDGMFFYEGDLLDIGKRVQIGGLDAQVELMAYDARIENLNSVGAPLFLLDPVLNEPHLLNNTATFGVGSSPLRLGIKFMFALLADGSQIQNDVDISLDLSSATVAAAALLKIAEDRFMSFPLRDFLNIDCWLATLPAPPLDSHGLRVEGAEPSASLKDIAALLASVDLNITCINCTSPKMEELAGLLSSKEGGEDATKVVNMILDFAMKLLGGEFLTLRVDRLLNEAPKRCPHRPEYQPQPVEAEYEPLEPVDTGDGSAEFLITLMVVTICIILAFALVSLAVRRIVRRRHGIWLHSLSEQSVALIRARQDTQKAKEAEINRMTTSMFTSTDIPCYVRWLMPLVILGNIGFFLSGHLSLGATVNIEAEIGGQTFSEDGFFEFSIAKSTIDIWNAGGKALAILMAIFSGLWPYTKQLMLLTLWFCPPRFVSTSRRGSTFLWLDTLGKWSMVDIFVLVVSIAAFWVSIESPDVAFLPEGFYSVKLLVVPLWGLYANMIAQLISQVSSHVIIHYHRHIVDSASARCDHILSDTTRSLDSVISEQLDASQEEADERTILRQHAFERPHRGEFDRLQVRRGVNGSLCVVALAVTVLVILGCVLPSVSMAVLGILGVAVESGQEFQDAMNYHSVFTLVRLLMNEARFLDTAGDYIGLGTLSALFVVTIFVVPILQVLTLLRQWFMPLTQKQRTRMSVLTEILQAWQYVEVYVLAIVVSAWQLGPVSEYMINSYCDGLTGTFATLVYYGILDPADAQCFKVEAGIESATYLLIAAAVLLGVVHTFVVKAVTQYERDVSQLHTSPVNAKLGDSESGMSPEEYEQVISRIDPVPVLFTDTFRWVMHRDDAVIGSRARRGLDERSKLGVDNGFPTDEPSALERSFSEKARPADDSDSEDKCLASIPDSAQCIDEGMPFTIEDRSEYGSSIYEDERPSTIEDRSEYGSSIYEDEDAEVHDDIYLLSN